MPDSEPVSDAELKSVETGTSEEAAQETESGSDGLFEVTVNGEKKLLTRDELVKYASLGFEGHRRIEEARSLASKASRGMRIEELLEELQSARGPQDVSPEKLAELGRLFGMSAEQSEQFASELLASAGADTGAAGMSKEDNSGAAGQSELEDIKTKLAKLSETVSALTSELETARTSSTLDKIRGDVRISLDKDPVLGRLMRDKDRASELVDLAFSEVRRRVVEGGESYGPDLLKRVAESTRARLQRLGIRQGVSPEEEEFLRTSFGPSQTPSPAFRIDKPVDRVPATDPKYRSNFGQRLIQAMFGAAQGSSG